MSACLGDGVCTDPQCPRHGIEWGVTEDLVEKARAAYLEATLKLVGTASPPSESVMLAVLAAVVPEVRRQLLGDVVAALDAAAEKPVSKFYKDGLEYASVLVYRMIPETRPDDDPAPVASCNGKNCGGYPHE